MASKSDKSVAKNAASILLVEGKNDFYVVQALFEQLGVPQTFYVIDPEKQVASGVEYVFADIPVRLKQATLERLGIIVDADSAGAKERWQQLHSIFLNVGMQLPTEIPFEGFVADIPYILAPKGSLRLGIWLMPDNSSAGMLEDFMRLLIPTNDLLLRHAEASIDDILAQNLNLFVPAHRMKALLHTWLAWQKDPGTPLGLAITKKYFSTDTPITKAFISWIHRLFINS